MAVRIQYKLLKCGQLPVLIVKLRGRLADLVENAFSTCYILWLPSQRSGPWQGISEGVADRGSSVIPPARRTSSRSENHSPVKTSSRWARRSRTPPRRARHPRHSPRRALPVPHRARAKPANPRWMVLAGSRSQQRVLPPSRLADLWSALGLPVDRLLGRPPRRISMPP
jgi:hypothetical protein